MPKAIPKVQTDDPNLSRIQDNIIAAIKPLLRASGESAPAASAIPTGAVLPFAGSSPPDGYLLCNGAAVSRLDYATLFAVVGTVYGSGDGVTTFNLPDGRGRALIGAGQGSGLTTRALGATGGEESHTLSADEAGVAAHTHTQGLYSAVNEAAGYGLTVVSGFADRVMVAVTGGNSTGSASAAASSAHNTMPPFVALNHIIKT